MRIPKTRKLSAGHFRIAMILLLVTCLLAGCFEKETVFQDYASAGAYCEPKFAARTKTVTLTVNTKDYNEILGAGNVLNKVMKEAIVHTGDPKLGDHVAMGITEYTLTGSARKKEDRSYDLTMHIEPVYNTTAEQEEELAKAAKQILASLHLNAASEYDKVLAIYRYICDHVVYDYEHLDDKSYLLQYSAYAAATKGTAVCAGIADLFYYLANSAGLDARIVTNSNHAWNFVRIDGKYYYADATWDLGNSQAEYEFFLKGSADFKYHMGNISFGPNGFSGLLNGSDLKYDFSTWAYGYDPYAR